MSWFPFRYRDRAGWHADGLPITAASDESAKTLDAAMTQLILHENDPTYGGFVSTFAGVLKPDPDFVMGNVIVKSYETFAQSPRKATKQIFDINQFVEKCGNLHMSQWERLHVKALSSLAKEDWITCADIYEDILMEHPKDCHALQMLFGIYLYTGMSDRLRDCHQYAAKHHNFNDRFFGNIHGKICFGQLECGQFVAAEKSGQMALDHTPNDIWSIHSMVHIREETLRPNEGLKFMEERASNWQPRMSLTQHMWWHKALFNIALEKYEDAVTIFDERLKEGARNDNNVFHLSDTTSLLMRLELESKPVGVSLKDRWREIARLYEDHIEGSDALLFYDFHTLLACLYGDQPDWASRVTELVTKCDEKRTGWSSEMNRRFGASLCQALTAFASGDYEQTVNLMKPIRYDLMTQMGGSHAQKDVLNQILVWAAIKSKNHHLADHLLQERLARTTLMVPDHPNLIQNRFETALAMI